MANPERGEVEVYIGDGGEARILRYDWGALAATMRESGAKTYDDLHVALSLVDMNVVLVALFHGLRSGGEKTLKRGDLDGLSGDIRPVRTAIMEAVNLALGVRNEEGTATSGNVREKAGA